jgi:hypothetical protein
VAEPSLRIFQEVVRRVRSNVAALAWTTTDGMRTRARVQSTGVKVSNGDNKRYNLLVLPKSANTHDSACVEDFYKGNDVAKRLAKKHGSMLDVVYPYLRSWSTEASGADDIYTPNNPSLIASKPGCSPQAPHTDVAIFSVRGEVPQSLESANGAMRAKQAAWESAPAHPLSVLVSTDPETHLWVWKESHKHIWYKLCGEQPPGLQRSVAQLLHLDPGMACIFTGACVHAGAGLPSTARKPQGRIHVYLDTEDGGREFNSTGPIEYAEDFFVLEA